MSSGVVAATLLLIFALLIGSAWYLGGKAGRKKAEQSQKDFLDSLKK